MIKYLIKLVGLFIIFIIGCNIAFSDINQAPAAIIYFIVSAELLTWMAG